MTYLRDAGECICSRWANVCHNVTTQSQESLLGTDSVASNQVWICVWVKNSKVCSQSYGLSQFGKRASHQLYSRHGVLESLTRSQGRDLMPIVRFCIPHDICTAVCTECRVRSETSELSCSNQVPWNCIVIPRESWILTGAVHMMKVIKEPKPTAIIGARTLLKSCLRFKPAWRFDKIKLRLRLFLSKFLWSEHFSKVCHDRFLLIQI